MPRRIVVKRDEIYKRRSHAWERYYKLRELARQMTSAGWDGGAIAAALKRYDEYTPELEIDGRLLDTPLEARRKYEHELLSRFRLSDRELLCPWLWTEQGWMEFVRQFNALPEPAEDYYLRYEPMPLDRLRLVPMSSKPKQGAGTTAVQKAQVPYFAS